MRYLLGGQGDEGGERGGGGGALVVLLVEEICETSTSATMKSYAARFASALRVD